MKALFIHIPKTSGQSAKSDKRVIYQGHRFLRDNVKNNAPDQRYFEDTVMPKHIIPQSKPFIFTIVRNPFDLLVSYYEHVGRKYGATGWAGCNEFHNFKSFEQFIRAYCNPKYEWHIPLLQRMLFSQLFDNKGNCVPNLIIKLEHREAGIKALAKHTGITLSSKRVNTNSSKPHYTSYYSPELRRLVEQKCSYELDLFGYNFEGSTGEHFIYQPSFKWLP